jgi:hypothetical protein
MNNIEDPFLASLVARYNQPGVIGIALVGSYARGENGLHSDVDLDILVDSSVQESYTLQYVEGKLVSLKALALAKEYSSLTKPEKAIWAVPGLSQMQILLDGTGQLAALKRSAEEFQWSPLQPAADEYAVEELMGCAEEIHKIISGLEQKSESKVLYAVWGLFKGLTNAVAVQRGLMIPSENRYFDILQDSLGRTHAWTKAFRLAMGAEIDGNVIYRSRGNAALELYTQTALLFKDIIGNEHREVIETTLKLIEQKSPPGF